MPLFFRKYVVMSSLPETLWLFPIVFCIVIHLPNLFYFLYQQFLKVFPPSNNYAIFFALVLFNFGRNLLLFRLFSYKISCFHSYYIAQLSVLFYFSCQSFTFAALLPLYSIVYTLFSIYF